MLGLLRPPGAHFAPPSLMGLILGSTYSTTLWRLRGLILGLLGLSLEFSWAPPGAHFEASWGPLGLIWGLLRPSGLLGPPGAHFGSPEASWGSFGASWVHFGPPAASWDSFGVSERLLAHFGPPGAHVGPPEILGFILGLLRPPGAHFGPPEVSWGSFWPSWSSF